MNHKQKILTQRYKIVEQEEDKNKHPILTQVTIN